MKRKSNNNNVSSKKKTSRSKIASNSPIKVVDNDTLLHIKVLKESNEVFEPQHFLKHFLSPISTEEFFSTILHSRALAITGLGSNRFSNIIQEYFCNGDPTLLIKETASDDGVSVWIPEKDDNNKGIQSFKVTDPNLSLGLLTNIGASLYMRAPQQTCEILTKSAFRDLNFEFSTYQTDDASRGEVEIFLASQVSRKTPTHTDFQQNFTFQLIGSKKWRLQKGDVKNPIRAKSPHFSNTPIEVIETQLLANKVCDGTGKMDPPDENDEENWFEVELHAGDVLYHPPGIWHNVQTTKVDPLCLSVNISLVTPTWADIISWAVKQMLWKEDILRRSVSRRDMDQVNFVLKSIGFSLPDFSTNCLLPPQEKEPFDHHDNDSEDSVLVWEEIEVKSIDFNKTTFRKNPLAEMVFDSDAFSKEEEEEEDDDDNDSNGFEVMSMVININIGSPDLEPTTRFVIVEIPKYLHEPLVLLKNLTSKEKLTKSVLIKYLGEDYDFEDIIMKLIQLGFLIQLE